jgi:polyisoprenoid-binding protein YceI
MRPEWQHSMRCMVCAAVAATAAWISVAPRASGAADARKIDSAHSRMTVRVFKSGLFSAFAHNHEIEAPIKSGAVNESGILSAELHVDARKLLVLDPKASANTRTKIQETMLGREVLDANQFPEITFQSTAVEPRGTDHWRVQGNLDLHGQTRPVAVDVALKDGVYRGTATLKQTDFGMKPVSIAGGTVNVKDEVKIEFEIALLK